VTASKPPTLLDELRHPIGVALRDGLPPEDISGTARWIEDLGFSHIAIGEDCWHLPAQVGATLALQATHVIPVGTVVSAMTRHPAILAMEIAGIARAFPGRFWPGIGLGMPSWLTQMGVMPAKAVGATRERVEALRHLMSGDTVTFAGETFKLSSVQISHEAPEQVPITMAVMGPMMLRLAGQIADAALFAVTSGLDYFQHAIAEIDRGLARARRSSSAVTRRTVAFTCVHRDGDEARRLARPVFAEFITEFADMPTFGAYGIKEELKAMVGRGGAAAVAAEMPSSWLEDLALVGSPAEVAEKVIRWTQAGVEAIAVLSPDEYEHDVLTLIAQEVIPRVTAEGARGGTNAPEGDRECCTRADIADVRE
jgi:5,10-methylenetetrahydromethanopterin reductase